MLHYAFVALVVFSMAVIIKVEYFDSRLVRFSVGRPGDVVILVKGQAVYVTRLQARERRLLSALGGVGVGLQLRSKRSAADAWKKKSGYSS